MNSTRLRWAIVIALFGAGCQAGVKDRDVDIPRTSANPSYERIVPAGQPNMQGGLYDPTVQFTPDGKLGALAYSAIVGSPAWKFPIGPYINTDIAVSRDGGRSWRYTATVNKSVDGKVTLPDGSTLAGVWRYEVPSLAYDSSDNERPWKLFTHRYFWSEEKDRMPAFGWIALKSAASPEGPWSEEVALFGSSRFPPQPYRTRVNVNAMDRSVADAIAYTEPGAMAVKGTIYLSLTALGRRGPEKIVLLASRDHGRTWDFRGVLVTNDDAEALGYKKFDGSALVEDRGRYYLLVSPEGRKALHEGTLVIEFTDLAHGKLARDSRGRLAPRKIVTCQTKLMAKPGCGQADYDESSAVGMIMPQVNFSAKPQVFQIWATGVRPGD